MTRWNNLAQFYHVELIFPFILENNPLISTESIIRNYSRIVPDSFDVVGWSKGTITILNTLQHSSYKIDNVVIISPWVIDKPTENYLLLHNIFKNNQNIVLKIFRGEEDVDIPEYLVSDFIKQAKRNGLSNSLIIVPHSSHWNYWEEPLEIFLSN